MRKPTIRETAFAAAAAIGVGIGVDKCNNNPEPPTKESTHEAIEDRKIEPTERVIQPKATTSEEAHEVVEIKDGGVEHYAEQIGTKILEHLKDRESVEQLINSLESSLQQKIETETKEVMINYFLSAEVVISGANIVVSCEEYGELMNYLVIEEENRGNTIIMLESGDDGKKSMIYKNNHFYEFQLKDILKNSVLTVLWQTQK